MFSIWILYEKRYIYKETRKLALIRKSLREEEEKRRDIFLKVK